MAHYTKGSLKSPALLTRIRFVLYRGQPLHSAFVRGRSLKIDGMRGYKWVLKEVGSPN